MTPRTRHTLAHLPWDRWAAERAVLVIAPNVCGVEYAYHAQGTWSDRWQYALCGLEPGHDGPHMSSDAGRRR